MAKVGDMLQRDGDAALSTPSDTENGKLQMPTQPGAQDCLDPGTIQLGATSQKARLEDRSWVLHFNFMSASTTQAATTAILSATVLGLAILIAELVIKSKLTVSSSNFRRKVANCNIAASGMCLQLLVGNLAVFVWHVADARRNRKRWHQWLQSLPNAGCKSTAINLLLTQLHQYRRLKVLLTPWRGLVSVCQLP